MGCDIHLHIEVKAHGKWEHYTHPRIPRNYTLFGKMAGVRGDEPPISPPKGLPVDCNAATKLDYDIEGPDAHSASWLSSSEVCELKTWGDSQPYFGVKADGTRNGFWFDNLFGFFFGNSFDDWGEYPYDFKRVKEFGVEDFRFVFWFDC